MWEEGLDIIDSIDTCQRQIHLIAPDYLETNYLLGVKSLLQMSKDQPNAGIKDSMVSSIIMYPLKHLDETSDFIHGHLCSGDQVFVHCQAGVSRSVSVAMIKYYDQPIICPNRGFINSLVVYNGSSLKSIYY